MATDPLDPDNSDYAWDGSQHRPVTSSLETSPSASSLQFPKVKGQSPQTRSQCITVSKGALKLLSKAANLGKQPVEFDDRLAPEIRQPRYLEVPLPSFWTDEDLKQSPKIACSKGALALLQKTRERLSGRIQSPLLGIAELPQPPKFVFKDGFDKLPYFPEAPEFEEQETFEKEQEVPTTSTLPTASGISPPLGQRIQPPEQKSPGQVISDISNVEKSQPGLNPQSFYSARDIYSFTGNRSVRTSWENSNSTKPMHKGYEEDPSLQAQDSRTRAMLAKTVAPKTLENKTPPVISSSRSYPEYTEDWLAMHQILDDQRHLLTDFPAMIKDDDLCENGPRSRDDKGPNLERPHTAGTTYSDLPDDILEHANAVESVSYIHELVTQVAVQAISSGPEMPYRTDTDTDLQDTDESPKPTDNLAALVRKRKLNLNTQQRQSQEASLFQPPWVNILRSRQTAWRSDNQR